MLIAIGIPLLICILGLLMWALASNSIVKDAGRLMFFAGMLVTLLVVGAVKIRIP